MNKSATVLGSLAIVTASLFAPLAAQADTPGAHPFYRHALADLREARGLVAGDSYVRGAVIAEDRTIDSIDAAIADIKRAGFDDGKPMEFGIAPDRGIDKPGRLHRALEALHRAHRDVAQLEQDPAALELQRQALRHIDYAVGHDREAIRDVERVQ